MRSFRERVVSSGSPLRHPAYIPALNVNNGQRISRCLANYKSRQICGAQLFLHFSRETESTYSSAAEYILRLITSLFRNIVLNNFQSVYSFPSTLNFPSLSFISAWCKTRLKLIRREMKIAGSMKVSSRVSWQSSHKGSSRFKIQGSKQRQRRRLEESVGLQDPIIRSKIKLQRHERPYALHVPGPGSNFARNAPMYVVELRRVVSPCLPRRCAVTAHRRENWVTR